MYTIENMKKAREPPSKGHTRVARYHPTPLRNIIDSLLALKGCEKVKGGCTLQRLAVPTHCMQCRYVCQRRITVLCSHAHFKYHFILECVSFYQFY